MNFNRLRMFEDKVIKNFYRMDECKEKVIVDLYFDNFSELVDNNFGDDSVEKFNDTLFLAIESAFKEIPLRYKIELNIYIKDFGDYSQVEMEKGIVDNLLLKYFNFKSQDLRKKVRSLFMTLFGAGIILVSYLFSEMAKLPQILTDVVNIAGTLIVWEAAYTFFLDRGESKRLSSQYLRKLDSVSLKKTGSEGVGEKIRLSDELKKLIKG